MSRHEVSIGLPVYNGGRFLRAAIESILAQSFGDFELLVSDNASTDGTESIAREYAAADPRVRYERNEHNLGAVPNFNRTFERTTGRFFKWAAADDALHPDYLARTVAALAGDPELVVAHSRIRAIDVVGRELRTYDTGLEATHGARPSTRFGALVLVPHRCMEIFALTRREALARTGLQRPYHGCDRALLAELGLLGRFHHDPEALFENREHAQQYVRSIPAEERAHWADTRLSRRVGTPTWTLYRQYRSAVATLLEPGAEQRRCRRLLVRWWATNWHAARVSVELASALHPSFHRLAASARKMVDPEAPPAPGTPPPAPSDERRPSTVPKQTRLAGEEAPPG